MQNDLFIKAVYNASEEKLDAAIKRRKTVCSQKHYTFFGIYPQASDNSLDGAQKRPHVLTDSIQSMLEQIYTSDDINVKRELFINNIIHENSITRFDEFHNLYCVLMIKG